eukprot:tig00020616_g12278.t1
MPRTHGGTIFSKGDETDEVFVARWDDDALVERARRSIYQGYNLLVAASGTNPGPSRHWVRALVVLRTIGLLQLSALVLWLPGCVFCDDWQSDIFLFFLQLRPRFSSWGGFLALFWVSIALLALLLACLFLFFCKRMTETKALTTAVRWWLALLLVLEAPALLGSFGPSLACRGGRLEEFPSVACLAQEQLVIAVFGAAAIIAVACLAFAPALLFDPRPSAHAALARSTPLPDAVLAAVKTFLLLLALFSRDRGALRGGFGVAGAALYFVLFYYWLPPLRTPCILREAYLALLPLPCAVLGLAFCAAPGCAAPAAFWPALAGVALLCAPASALLVRARAAAAVAAARGDRERLLFFCGDACHDVAARALLAEETGGAGRSLAARLAAVGVPPRHSEEAPAMGPALEFAQARPRGPDERRHPWRSRARSPQAACERRPRSAFLPVRLAAALYDVPALVPLSMARPARPARPPAFALREAADGRRQAMARKARRMSAGFTTSYQAFFLEHQRTVEREEWGEEGRDVTEVLEAIGREERDASLRAAAFWTVVLASGRAPGSGDGSSAELSARASAAEESKQRARRLYGHLLQAHPHSVRVLRHFAAFQATQMFDIEGALWTAGRADRLLEQRRADRQRPAAAAEVLGAPSSSSSSAQATGGGPRELRLDSELEEGTAAALLSAPEPSEEDGTASGEASFEALRRQWARESGVQRLLVAADVRARYHRAFAVLHAAALLSVLAMLGVLFANYLVARADFHDHSKALKALIVDTTVRPFVVCMGEKARAFQLATMPSPPPLVPPAFRGPAAAAAAAEQLRACTEELRRGLQAPARPARGASGAARHRAYRLPRAPQELFFDAPHGAFDKTVPAAELCGPALGARELGETNRTLTLLEALLTAIRSADSILTTPPGAPFNTTALVAEGIVTPDLFYLLANVPLTIPVAYTTLAAGFFVRTIEELGAVRRTSIALFCTAVGLALFLILGVMLPVLWYVRRVRDRLLEVFVQIPRSTAREIRAGILAPLFLRRKETLAEQRGRAAGGGGAPPPSSDEELDERSSEGEVEVGSEAATEEMEEDDAEEAMVDYARLQVEVEETWVGALTGLFLRFCAVVLSALGLVAASFAIVLEAVPEARKRALLATATMVTWYGNAALAALTVELAVADSPVGAPVWRGGFREVQETMKRITNSYLVPAANALRFGGPVLTLPGIIDTAVNGLDVHTGNMMTAALLDSGRVVVEPRPLFDRYLYYDAVGASTAVRGYAVRLAARSREEMEHAIASLSLCFAVAVPLLVCLYAASLAPSIHRVMREFLGDASMLLYVPAEVLGELPALRRLVRADSLAASDPLAALASTRERNEALLRASLDPTFIVDAEGVIQKANGAAAGVLGCGAPEELVGARIRDFFPSLALRDRRPSTRSLQEGPSVRSGAIGGNPEEDSLEGVRRGGARFPAQVSLGRGLTESPDRDREEPFFVVVARDVSALVAEQRALRAAVERADGLLRAMVPADVARRLRAGEQLIADLLDDATLAFVDIPARPRAPPRALAPARLRRGGRGGRAGLHGDVGGHVPAQTVALLQAVFRAFDAVNERFNVEKARAAPFASPLRPARRCLALTSTSPPAAPQVKLIGDTAFYITQEPPEHMVEFCLAVFAAMRDVSEEAGIELKLRAGLNTGSVVAGVIATKKIAWDVYGDSVNLASRMESTGVPGRVQISSATYERVRFKYEVEPRQVEAKGKGTVQAYLVGARRQESGALSRLLAAAGHAPAAASPAGHAPDVASACGSSRAGTPSRSDGPGPGPEPSPGGPEPDELEPPAGSQIANSNPGAGGRAEAGPRAPRPVPEE